MNEEKSLKVLLAPCISEKASMLKAGYRQYVFRVSRDSTKADIRGAVEQLFQVAVRSVRVCNAKGKPTRFGRTAGRRKTWKKAYVMLNQDQEIDVSTSQV